MDEFGKKRVWAVMSDGRKYEGDMLIGADGIWSKVRNLLWQPVLVKLRQGLIVKAQIGSHQIQQTHYSRLSLSGRLFKRELFLSGTMLISPKWAQVYKIDFDK